MPQGKGGGRRVRQAGKPLSRNLTFRLDRELDRQLRRAAKEAGRSVSEEIQYRLRESFKPRSDSYLQADNEGLRRQIESLDQIVRHTRDHQKYLEDQIEQILQRPIHKGEEKK
jgi:replication-associated recombination protein RarA